MNDTCNPQTAAAEARANYREVASRLGALGLPSGRDQHLRAGAVRICGRDGAYRSPGSPSGAGTRRGDEQC